MCPATEGAGLFFWGGGGGWEEKKGEGIRAGCGLFDACLSTEERKERGGHTCVKVSTYISFPSYIAPLAHPQMSACIRYCVVSILLCVAVCMYARSNTFMYVWM